MEIHGLQMAELAVYLTVKIITQYLSINFVIEYLSEKNCSFDIQNYKQLIRNYLN